MLTDSRAKRHPWPVLTGVLPALIALTALCAPAIAGDRPGEYDRWFVIRANDQKLGWSHQQQQNMRDGRIVTANEVVLKIGRMDTELRIEFETVFIETADGEPVEMTTTSRNGALAETHRFSFGRLDVSETIERGGQLKKTVHPLPRGIWLTPNEVRTFVRKRLNAGAEKVTYVTLDPTTGLEPISFSHRLLEHTTIEAMGKVYPCVQVGNDAIADACAQNDLVCG